MSYQYDREELVKILSGAMSEFFLGGVPDGASAAEIRERVEAMARALARVQGVLASDADLGTGVLMDIRSLEQHHLRALLDSMHKTIRPSGAPSGLLRE